MRRSLSLTCCCLLALALPGRALGQEADPRQILLKALAAHGGKQNIEKPRKGILNGKSKNGVALKEMFDLPHRWKKVTTATLDDKQLTSTQLMVDNKLWEWTEDGGVRAGNKDDSTLQLDLLTNLVLILDKPAKLEVLPEIKVQDKPALGLRAILGSKGADHYFDKTTGLLIRSDVKWRTSNKEFEVQSVFSDYKGFDGLQVPHRRKTYVRGESIPTFELLADFEIVDVALVDSFPAETFKLPDRGSKK